MAPRPRYAPTGSFAPADDFDEQLYAALRKSPWWMISLAAHVLLFVLSSLLATDVAPTAVREAVTIATTEAPTPPEEEKPEDPDAFEHLRPDEMVVREPKTVETQERDTPQDDNDVPHDDVYGHVEDGPSSGDFEGISNNAYVGIGGGWKAGGFGLGGRKKAGGRTGGGRQAERAVDDALRWLAAHQSPDGAWEAEGFGRWCDGRPASDGPGGAGKAQYDVGVTGLALLAFLGAGHTHMDEGRYGDVVKRGLRWLRNTQDPEGCFGPRSSGHYVYNHAIATLAVVEAYAMTGSTLWKQPARKALDFVALCRNPYFAWRYGIKPGDNDTSVTGWMMMSLKSAKLVNDADVAAGRPPTFGLDADAFDGIRAWIDKMTEPETGRVGYQQRGSGPARPNDLVDRFPAAKSEAMTAVGVLARVFLGENPKTSQAVQKGAALMAALPPKWDPADGSVDMYYWYYATLAMFQVGDTAWKTWDAAMKPAMVSSQRQDGDYCLYKGSWDPIDPWGGDGGRVYATAVMAMCLEVYYRYDRVFGLAK